MAYQVSVFMENRPGRLEKISDLLGRDGINIRAMTLTTSSGGWGVLNLMVDQPQKARDALAAGGLPAALREIVVVEMPDRPGGLNQVVALLSRAGFNIENAYGTVLKEGSAAILVIDVENVARARELLQKSGVKTLADDDVYGI